ncbi:5'-3' exonuclease H3TH domain-containing protein [Cupriavidus metallidurans]|uniref:5'-3' exonuclease H3TH domain-containing protein n=1 Tax=Cupriavidus metallidurans TaxID=119219 RepID=UPI001CCA1AAC|nr:5'-3' exonuclease H3TH domain-containing protein [Cupriavidus metallidurans]UBM12717.1 hypothetical protein LAI70_28300 [Cupriavidus metallidurans]
MQTFDAILIDGNSVGRIYHAGRVLSTGALQTQALYGMVRFVRNVIEAHPGVPVKVLWDGRAAHRYAIYPDYKGNRVEGKDPKMDVVRGEYKKVRPFMMKALEFFPVQQLVDSELEADDLAGLLCTKTLVGKRIALFTKDSDWWQLVSDTVSCVHPTENRVLNGANFHQETGYHTPSAYLEGKALQGDGSDNIAGVGGIGEKGALDLMAKFGSVAGLFARIDGGEKVKGKRLNDLASTGRHLFERNMALMDLSRSPMPRHETLKVINGRFDEQKLRTLFEALAFVSIINDWAKFTLPLRNQ